MILTFGIDLYFFYQEKEALKIVNFTLRFLGLLHRDKCPMSMGNLSSDSELLLDLFPVFWSGGADQILFLEFSKDTPAGKG